MNTKKIYNLFILFLLPAVLIIFDSCREDQFLKDPVNLNISRDTVTFDTVFISIGSSTQQFKVFNPKDEDIKIDRIKLAGGKNSPFRINVNGLSGTEFENIEIKANDSIFIFTEVTVDPNNQSQPMIRTDSIVFNTNGNIQDIQLVAWGQDANFIVPDINIAGLPCNIVAQQGQDIVWDSPKPYVIYGYAVVDSTASLTIKEGTDVHFHANSGLWIYKGGNLKVEGTASNPVHFQGDRLEDYYSDVAGQWDRIWLNEGSIDNEIHHAIIENGFIGIQAEILSTDMGNKLSMDNVTIRNMTGIGVLGRNYRIDAENIEVSNTGSYSVALTNGGSYEFRHTTIANYWSGSTRQTPALYLNNFYEHNDGSVESHDLNKAYFGNCIIYGNQKSEFTAEDIDDGSLLEFIFDHSLVRTKQNTSGISWINCKINKNPLFTNSSDGDYTLKSSSPAIDAGTSSIQVPVDLKGDNRDNQPDMGAYEYVP